MKIKYKNGNKSWIYGVTPGTSEYVTLTNLTTGNVFKDHYTRRELESRIRDGDLIVVEEENSLKINVDSTDLKTTVALLDKAVELAKELETTLARIGVMAKQ
jgi:hypothetical protein